MRHKPRIFNYARHRVNWTALLATLAFLALLGAVYVGWRDGLLGPVRWP